MVAVTVVAGATWPGPGPVLQAAFPARRLGQTSARGLAGRAPPSTATEAGQRRPWVAVSRVPPCPDNPHSWGS